MHLIYQKIKYSNCGVCESDMEKGFLCFSESDMKRGILCFIFKTC